MTPHAKQTRVRLVGDLLKVWVVVAAEGGKANQAVESAVAAALGLKSREVRIVAGMRSRRKLMAIDGIHIEDIRNILSA